MHALYLILVESFDETWDVKDEKERKRVGGIVMLTCYIAVSSVTTHKFLFTFCRRRSSPWCFDDYGVRDVFDEIIQKG
jgi:hypothetical protein